MHKIIDTFDGEYAFLSNFYEHPFEFDGVIYRTAEHAFQAMKATNEHDRQMIINAATPGQAKRLGRKIHLRSDWEQVKEIYMLDIIRAKFGDPELGQMLMSTRDAYLIEGTTWHDNTWGNCSCDRCKHIEGKNYLGKILMSVRQDLIQLTPDELIPCMK